MKPFFMRCRCVGSLCIPIEGYGLNPYTILYDYKQINAKWSLLKFWKSLISQMSLYVANKCLWTLCRCLMAGRSTDEDKGARKLFVRRCSWSRLPTKEEVQAMNMYTVWKRFNIHHSYGLDDNRVSYMAKCAFSTYATPFLVWFNLPNWPPLH